MGKRLRFLPLLAGLSALTTVGSAWGQTITLVSTGFQIEREDERLSTEFPLRISREDCLLGAPTRYDAVPVDERDQYTWVHITPTVLGAGNTDSTQVWVSENTDCTTSGARNGSGTNGTCSLIAQTGANDRNPDIYVNPRDLVDRSGTTDWSEDVDLPASICTDPSNQVDLAISIQLIVSAGAETVHDSVEWTDTSLDLKAPSAPQDINAGPGDAHIFFDWEIDSEDEDQETNGFVFYCVPTGTTRSEVTVDAGTGGGVGTGGTSAGTGGTSVGTGGTGTASESTGEITVTCGQNILVEGELAAAEALQYECGEVIGRSARKGQADGLINDTEYAVAVAAIDVVGNSGVLSPVECLTPKEVTTFFEGYSEAGGTGGGGFCQTGQGRPGPLLWLTFLSSGLFLLRRRRNRA